MKNTVYILLCLLLVVSCGNGNNPQNEQKQERDTEAAAGNNSMETKQAGTSTEGSGNWQKLVMIPLKDAQGNVAAEAPYPADWKLVPVRQQGDPSIVGPHGLKVVDYNLKVYMYTNDPSLQSSYYATGQQLRPWPGVDAVIEQDIKPRAHSQGLTYVKHYEIPDVTRIDQWYSDQLYKAVPSQSQAIAVGTEWTMADGSPYFLLIHMNVSESANMQNWSIFSSGLQADKNYFERARKQYIFSLANTRYALEPIAAYNQREAQKAGQSWAAFNQRMAQNQAAFEAQQRAHVNKTEAINNAIMSSYNTRNAASDRQQEQTIDGIYERTKVQNTETGQNYKVEGYHNQYWMNSNGEYIGTNQSGYNPNLDENMNNQKWQELKQVPY